ncbi:general substrate transporter [Dichotomocladium elegans]|nr:general substrate transporter [Dichotomocladium elegans]
MQDFQSVFSTTDGRLGAMMVSVPLAISMFASVLSGPAADWIGRRKYFFVATILKFVGSGIQILASSFEGMLLGRIVAGAAIGIFSMLIPLYQSEISLPEHRGRLITFFQLGVTLGFCAAFWIVYGTSRLPGHLSWKIPVYLQMVPPTMLICGLFGLPESPRWLVYKKRQPKKALAILTRLRSASPSSIEMEIQSIEQDYYYDTKFKSRKSYMHLLEKGTENNRRRTLLGIGIHMLTQLTGINVLLQVEFNGFYLPHILQSTGITEIDSELLGNGVSGMVNMLATIPVFGYIDKWDRRRILTCASLLMAVCMIAIAVLALYIETSKTSLISNDSASFGVLVLLCLFIACFALSWGPLGWIYPAEIYPQSIRAKAMGLTTASSYCFNVTISQIAPALFESISWGTYVVFGCSCLLIAWIVHAFYPETRGRSLEEIHLIFSNAILINERASAHHPSTAAEALEHLETLRYDMRSRFGEAIPQMQHQAFI